MSFKGSFKGDSQGADELTREECKEPRIGDILLAADSVLWGTIGCGAKSMVTGLLAYWKLWPTSLKWGLAKSFSIIVFPDLVFIVSHGFSFGDCCYYCCEITPNSSKFIGGMNGEFSIFSKGDYLSPIWIFLGCKTYLCLKSGLLDFLN